MSFKDAIGEFETVLHLIDGPDAVVQEHLTKGLIELTRALRALQRDTDDRLRRIEGKVK